MSRLFDVAISFAMENEELADTIYHYLKAEGLSVFYAPAPECQSILSGENQREIFYRILEYKTSFEVYQVINAFIRRFPVCEKSCV